MQTQYFKSCHFCHRVVMLPRYLTIVLEKIISKTFGCTVIVTTGLIMCACSKDGNNQRTFLFLSFIITGCVTRQMSWHQIQKCTTVQKDFFPCGSMLYLYSLKALHKARPFTLFYAMYYCIRRDFHYTYSIKDLYFVAHLCSFLLKYLN